MSLTKVFTVKNAKFLLTGPDALDFIHRLSVSDLKKEAFTKQTATCFLNPKGKIIDHVMIFKQNEGLILLSSFQNKNILFDHLEGYHFSEDFIVKEIDIPIYIIITGDIFYYSLELPKDQKFSYIDENEWEIFRIEHMIPWGGHEIVQDFMPQEIGLEQLISHDKGCYIGQEVILKSLTFQKHKRSLQGLKLSEESLLNLNKGARILLENGDEAIITSVSSKYFSNKINALAIVRKNT